MNFVTLYGALFVYSYRVCFHLKKILNEILLKHLYLLKSMMKLSRKFPVNHLCISK